MVPQATLTAHLIDTLLLAGHDADQINKRLVVLIARETFTDELWVSNQNGEIDFTSHTEITFVFPTDPDSGTQT